MTRFQGAMRRLRARLGGGGVAYTLDAARWRRLSATDPAMAGRVVRALYLAVLDREPDPEGLAHHSRRLAAGLPLESLMAELAAARSRERPAAGGPAPAAPPTDEVSGTRDLQLAQQRTLRALTRRLARLEDRLMVQGEEGTVPDSRRP